MSENVKPCSNCAEKKSFLTHVGHQPQPWSTKLMYSHWWDFKDTQELAREFGAFDYTKRQLHKYLKKICLPVFKNSSKCKSSVDHIDALHSFTWCFFFLNIKALNYFPVKYWNICENVVFLIKQIIRFWVETIRHALPAATQKQRWARGTFRTPATCTLRMRKEVQAKCRAEAELLNHSMLLFSWFHPKSIIQN